MYCCDWASLGRHCCYFYAHAATFVWWEVSCSRHLAITLRRHHDQLLVIRITYYIHAHDCIVWTKPDAAYATCRTSHWTHFFLIKAHCLARRSRDDNVILTCRTTHPTQLVAVIKLNRNEAIRTNILIIFQSRLLDCALGGRHKQEAIFTRFATLLNYRRNLFVWMHTEQVHCRRTLRNE